VIAPAETRRENAIMRPGSSNVARAVLGGTRSEALADWIHQSRGALQQVDAGLATLRARWKDDPAALGTFEAVVAAEQRLKEGFDELDELLRTVALEKRRCDVAQLWRSAWELLARSSLVELVESGGTGVFVMADPGALANAFRRVFGALLGASRNVRSVVVRCTPSTSSRKTAIRIDFSTSCEAAPSNCARSIALYLAARVIAAHGGRSSLRFADRRLHLIVALPTQ